MSNYISYTTLLDMFNRSEVKKVCSVKKSGRRPSDPLYAFSYNGRFGRGWTVERGINTFDYVKEFYIICK